ncbi:MAG TPA: PhzF family phenazine biosynthesis protein [Verrucomicrobiae bacterium]|nr:PhzF family phenazine biosynthesis protein [Verrucomicrobiae bacterium]
MRFPIWQVDAFASRLFGGNPAAIVPLQRWLPEATMQAIAAENNLAETAFFVPQGDDYAIRWFTPVQEVPLCGHATLASGWVVLNKLDVDRQEVTFHSKSGPLRVLRGEARRLALDLPSIPPGLAARNPQLVATLGAPPRELFEGFQWLAVYESEAEVRALKPDFPGLASLPLHAVIASARGTDCDFVSRFFVPSAGINEDPATGSAHSRLVPYWARVLGKSRLHARQISARGAEFWCEIKGDRVILEGEVAPYLEGTIEV